MTRQIDSSSAALSQVFVVVFVIVFWISSSSTSHAASFYGSSYVSLPLQEARSTTELSFRFRTSRPDALLLLAAGRTDYCLVVLQSATLKVRINLGAGEAEVATPTGLRLDDLVWHEVRIQRKDADFILTVDNLHISKLKLPGRFYELNIHYGLFVGGLGDFREIFLGLWDNFRGCINDLIYNGVDVLTKAKDATNSADLLLPGNNNNSVIQHQRLQQQHQVSSDGTNSGGAIWVGATWDCSAEFDATSQQDVSFLAPDSYVAFAGGSGSGIAKTGSKILFQLKTLSREAVLLYSSGPPAKPDFAAVELVEGHLRVSTDSGSGGGGAVDIFSEQAVHDGLWHKVELHLAAGAVEMTIDGRTVSSSSNQLSSSSSSGKRYLELSGQIYLGGIDPARHLRALNQGVRTANTSLRGCIRSLELDGRQLGLREARVTRKIAADCQWHYACATKPTPCVDGAQCHQEGLDDFRCDDCSQASCVRPDYVQHHYTTTSSSNAVTTGNNGVDDTQLATILSLTPVQVTEGGSMTLSSRHLQLLIDYEKFGVRESGVLFHVIRPPQHGRLSSTLWRRADEAATFTLLDVHSDRVRYIHDGSETIRDSALLELELAPRGGFLLPAYLQKRHRFLLQLVISSVNDPPELSLPAGKAVLRLVKHTRKVLSADLLTATDPDSSPRELVYSVLNSKSDGDMEGSVENKQQPGVAINSFTQEDINLGRIWYVHRGSPNGRLALRVSDGTESGPTAVLRIAAFDLQVFLANNTGLVVPVNGSAALTAANLTFSTNAPDQDLDIRYDITRPPLRGQIQSWRGGRWQSVGWFTSGQLQRGERLRYVHLPPPPSSSSSQQLIPATAVQQDDFQFSVSVALEVAEVFRSATLYQFRLQLQDSIIRLENNRPLNMSGIGGNQQAVIDGSFLKYVTEPHATADDEIVYTLIDPPVYGSLWVMQQPDPLVAGSKWTQKTVSTQRFHYKLARRTLSDLQDRFTFRVSEDSLVTDPQQFNIYFTADRRDMAFSSVTVTIGQLLVNEGETAVLQSNQLSLSVPLVVNYTVTESPVHGQLNLLDLSRRAVLRKNVRWFGSDEVADQRIVYTHDDSESPKDRFRFVARPRLQEGNINNQLFDFQYVGDIPIVVRMKNDNQPVRVVDRVLRVVTNSERKLNSDILKYVDPDVDTDPANIIFTRRGVPNGAFYFTDRPDVQVFQFSQSDVNQGKVLFRHQGSAFGRTALWVTDGLFHATGALEVQASEPFLERVNQTVLTVQRTRSAVLGVEHLGLISNMDYADTQLIFHLVDEPQSGTIRLAGSEDEIIESFSQADLVSGKVSYSHWNNRSENGRDRFTVRAALGNIDYEGIVDVRIYSESYWQPLKVLQNQLVTVEEGTSFTIDPSSLRIGYAVGVNPQDVQYMVHQPPIHGYLEVDRDEHEEPDEPVGSSVNNRLNLLPPEVHVFDQSAINEHRLHYIQSGANQSSDHFVFDVTNGVTTLTNLTFQLAIIPKSIYLLTRPVEVLEGGQVVLTVTDLKIVTRYYADKVDGFVIVRPPIHGSLLLKSSSSSDSSSSELLSRFTYAQLMAKEVVYWHDGSEEATDSMDIVALAGKKESLPATVQIKVRPVDDERPLLVNNTGILVWQGSTTLLDNAQLGATDVDTLPHSIEFSFEKPDCGYLASGPNLSEPVSVITQRQIELRQVVFVHQIGRTNNCSVRFNLTDGQSSLSISQHRLQISARKMQMRLVRNQRLHVFPLMQQSITSAQLLAVTNGGDSILNQQQNLPRFQVVRPPRLGRLLLEGPDGSTRRVTHFTQSDLNQSLVIYEHTEPFADLSVSDSFAFDVVSDLSSPLQQQQFEIEISVATMAEGGLDRYLGLLSLETEEGGTAVIREKNLNLSGIVQLISAATTGYSYQPIATGSEPRLKLLLSKAPMHGFISVAGRRLISGGEVEVGEIAAGRFVYQHDHSDTLEDFIGLTVLLQPGKGSEERRPDILLYNGTLHVNILPVNDQVFHLLTKAPAMTVVERQWKAITPEVLMTEDADTSAKDLIYEVIQPPKYGKLAVTQPDNSTVAVSGTVTSSTGMSTSGTATAVSTFLRFSQDDVNRGRVVYLHDGTMEPRSTSFYFRVSDGHFKADSGVFTLRFEPLTLKLANHSIINIQQGQSTAVVGNSSMGAESNGQRRHIFYNITREPENGRLYINDVHVTTFGQSNIDKEELLYVQFNMMASSDWFQVTVWNMAVILERQIFNVSVAPLIGQIDASVKRPVIRATVGEKTAITIASLDASRLATLTNSNPTFTVLRKPRYGKIRKIVPSSSGLNRLVKRQSGNGNKEKDTNVFSHEDVQSNFIFYVARKTETGNETQLIDSCEYRLTAPNVQPAIGVLEFHLVPSGSTLVAASKNSIDVAQAGSANNVNPRNPSPTDIVTENTLAGLGLGIGIDIFLIVGIVCGILGLGLVVLIIIKCRIKPTGNKQPKNETGSPSAGEMQLYRLSGTLNKNGHLKTGMSDFQVTDAYRISTNMLHHQHPRDFDTDSDQEPPLPPRLDYMDPPLSPRPSRAMRGLAGSPIGGSSTISSLQGNRARGSWHHHQHLQQKDSIGTPASLPQCKIIPLMSERSESEASELVNARYPYGIADESMEEWAMLEPENSVHCTSTYSSRTTNPMLRKNQYWV